LTISWRICLLLCVLLTIELTSKAFDAGSRWSHDIAAWWNRRPQSEHGASLSLRYQMTSVS